MTTRFSSALAMGTTGMLWEATRAVTQSSDKTLILSRQAEAALHKDPLPGATPLNINYSDKEDFQAALLSHIDIAVLWVHNPGLPSLFWLLEAFAAQAIRIVHVAGSAAGDPERQATRVAEKVKFGPDCQYCPVILGAMPTPDGRRWLTHEEICAGTIEAIRSGITQMIGHRLTDLN